MTAATQDELFDAVKSILLQNTLFRTMTNPRPPIDLPTRSPDDHEGVVNDVYYAMGIIGEGVAEEVLSELRTLYVPQPGERLSEVDLPRNVLYLAQSHQDRGNYRIAVQVAVQVVRRLVARHSSIPGPSNLGLLNPAYQGIRAFHPHLLYLYDAYRILARNTLSQLQFSQALVWHEETLALECYTWLTGPVPNIYDWQHFNYAHPPYALRLSDILISSARASKYLKNSGIYHFRMLLAYRYLESISDDSLSGSGSVALLDHKTETMNALRLIRHPDPQERFDFKLLDPEVQASGSWKRLYIKINEGMGKRAGCSAFVWQGCMYIVGGSQEGFSSEESGAADPQDIWRVQLNPPGEWEFFVKFPPTLREYPRSAPSGTVLENKLYLFTGNPYINVLDLVTRQWTQKKTTYKPTLADTQVGLLTGWPWLHNRLDGASQGVIGETLLVFGGIGFASPIGSNLFMELNLRTMKWRRLGGYPFMQKESDPMFPGPRYSAVSWTDRENFYVMYGVCDHVRPGVASNDYGPSETWVWDDFWRWNIQEQKWRQERIAGNPPAPRYEMGFVHNQKLGKVIVFEGVNPMCHYQGAEKPVITSTIFADTFILDTTMDFNRLIPLYADSGNQASIERGAHSWKQVLTCGFPTYRVKPVLVCDPDTGKVYMYGGAMKSDFVPTRRTSDIKLARQTAKRSLDLPAQTPRSGLEGLMDDLSRGEREPRRHFGDVWQLHIDTRGGYFEEIDKEEEIRTAQPGPWDRCFECGKAGFWKQCGGVCNGKVHFCSRECQVKGWRVHKQMHSCRKP